MNYRRLTWIAMILLSVAVVASGCASTHAPDMGNPNRILLAKYRECEAAVYSTTGVPNAPACQKFLDDIRRN